MSEKKYKTLRELSTTLQTLCHHGHSLSNVVVDINGPQVHLADIDDVKILKDGTVSLVLGDWKNTDMW